MKSKLLSTIGVIFCVGGLLYLRGPAITISEHLLSIVAIVSGVLLIGKGTKELFKND